MAYINLPAVVVPPLMLVPEPLRCSPSLVQVERLREVLEQGSIVQQKEFLKGIVADITLYAGKNRGLVRYYDLLSASFKYSGGTGDVLEKMRDWLPTDGFRWDGVVWREAA